MTLIQLGLPDHTTLTCAAVLFDMDGVLVDSAAVIEQNLRGWAGEHGLDADHVIAVCPGRTLAELVAEVAPFLDARAEAQRLLEQDISNTDRLTACPGAEHLIRQLPESVWAVVTSGHYPVAVTRLTHTRLPIPDVLITADDVSTGKPAPEGYLTAASRLGVEPRDCVVIEDAPAGLHAAKAAGMRAIAIAGREGGPFAPYDHRIESLSSIKVLHIDTTPTVPER
ncbi:HAD-IA family hydrolase [Nocardia arthritidis]|uniref:HAD-IA family hydrolase n=1 Tax=Nocardia arthritidis TaxID=228602 RepID=A0A6G9YL52_9NOCA|nr:HAD-IA family hydrolase [Nocardia arthritidis]QIS13914.1 HAD-IA family hydrolase [Nocardia arthritidis]QIS13928.1 HAD-IA family hydrolase [Nocardia arthritidis]